MKDAIMQHLEAAIGGSFLVRNEGAFVASMLVTYKFAGKEFSISHDFAVGQSRSVEVPAGAVDIHLIVKEAVFFHTWSTIFSKSFDQPVTKCYKVWGTTLNPKYEEIKC